MSIALADFDKIVSLTGLKKTESDYPAIEVIQLMVCTSFENYTRRLFEVVKRVEVITLCGGERMIPLKGIPIKTVSFVRVDSVETEEYKLMPYGILLTTPPANDFYVEVEYKGGYSSIPEDIANAALLQVVFDWQQKESIGVKSVSTSGGTTSKDSVGMLYQVKDILNNHVHPFPVF